MADLYVRSTDGSDADNGSTWALAKATLAGAFAAAANGDSIYVSQAHSEGYAAGQTLTMPTTNQTLTEVICANDGAAPPTALATSALFQTTGNTAINWSGPGYLRGLTIECGTGANSQPLTLQASASNRDQVWELCTFRIPQTRSGSRIVLGATATAMGAFIFKDCQFRFGHASQGFDLKGGPVHIRGGGIEAGGTALTADLFRGTFTSAHVHRIVVEDCDLSGLGSSCNIFNITSSSQGAHSLTGVIRNCKLPSGWTGSLVNGTILGTCMRFALINTDSADTQYRIEIQSMEGAVYSETGVYADATLYAVPASWKMVSSASARRYLPLETAPGTLADLELGLEITAAMVGNPVTVTAHLVHDSATNLTDQDFAIEASYPGTSGSSLGVRVSSWNANMLAAGTDLATSTRTWAGTGGFGTVNKQKASVTFTPSEAGRASISLCLGLASKTIYVDPDLEVAV